MADIPYHVYGLYDPDSKLLRWVGVTQKPDVRRRGMSNGSGAPKGTPVREWILGLKKAGKKPIFRVLVSLSGEDARIAAFASETRLIRRYAGLKRWADLLNIAGNPERQPATRRA